MKEKSISWRKKTYSYATIILKSTAAAAAIEAYKAKYLSKKICQRAPHKCVWKEKAPEKRIKLFFFFAFPSFLCLAREASIVSVSLWCVGGVHSCRFYFSISTKLFFCVCRMCWKLIKRLKAAEIGSHGIKNFLESTN